MMLCTPLFAWLMICPARAVAGRKEDAAAEIGRDLSHVLAGCLVVAKHLDLQAAGTRA